MILCDPYLLLLQGCVGALDGTHIPVHVPAHARGRYRNRKGDLTTNVLGVCSPDAESIFVLVVGQDFNGYYYVSVCFSRLLVLSS